MIQIEGWAPPRLRVVYVSAQDGMFTVEMQVRRCVCVCLWNENTVNLMEEGTEVMFAHGVLMQFLRDQWHQDCLLQAATLTFIFTLSV